MKRFICLISFITTLIAESHGQVIVRGIVYGVEKQPLIGAGVSIRGASQGTFTDSEGKFGLNLSDSSAILVVSYVGYMTKEIGISSDYISVGLELISTDLKEVVVSTGYQKLPAGRATGSFSAVNEELLNRRVSTDILSRISDLVPGLTFHQGRAPGLRIRGQSTIFADPSPLIVIDNFPYEGDPSSINPNDVESITVLKDAAAASIWGTRAGNGVLNSNITIGQRPSLYYQPQMSVEDYISIERELFQAGFFNSDENSINRMALSPVLELLIQNRDGKLSNEALNAEVARLKNNDVRRDYEKHFYRSSLSQQYSLNISAGTDKHKIVISAGHDRQMTSINRSDYNRSSFSMNNSLKLMGNKLTLTSGIYFSENNRISNGIDRLTMNGNPIFPYARMEQDGNPLAVLRNVRSTFIEDAENKGLLSWKYYPLEELELADNRSLLTDYRIVGEVNYQVAPGLGFSGLYQYGGENTTAENLYLKEGYFARDLINRFTQIGAGGNITYKLPYGDILDQNRITVNTHNLRGQFNYDKKWNTNNELKGIIGAELRTRLYKGAFDREYGYNSNYASTSLIDYVSLYPSYVNGFNMAIPYMDKYTELNDYNLSYYGNVTYGFHNRYFMSLTARVDKSNLFGVETNQKSVPLYSVGGSWELSKESFYKLNFLPYARLRVTWGYNGNIDKKVSAFTTARYGLIDTDTQIPYSQIQNPPNPQLRWERVGILNTALDFSTFDSRISGSIEYYLKHGVDLIGDIQLAPSSGVSTFRGNYAETKGHGVDFSVQTRNLKGKVKWNTDVIISLARDKVVKYDRKSTALNYVDGGDNSSFGIFPLEGRPLLSVFSFRFKGLDGQTGNPIGYLNGEESQNYSGIVSSTTPEELIYHGSARPTWFGSVRNHFSYRGFSISGMISYRGGYYFRRSSVRYGSNAGLSSMHGDYAQRWMKPGDEVYTNVPSVPSSPLFARDNLYIYGESLVEKGDHIRLKDIELSFTISKEGFKNLFIKNLKIYTYADNLGILWKSAKGDLDPDYAYSFYPPVRTLSIGLRADL
jgi:TonB-linked SusC/RagA family outer membrane protein